MSSMKKWDLSLIVYKLNRTYKIFSGNFHKYMYNVRNRVWATTLPGHNFHYNPFISLRFIKKTRHFGKSIGT